MDFFGEYKHAIDVKNRVSIPAKFREKLGDVFYVTKGFDQCLFVFTKEGWEAFVAELSALPLSNKKARAMTRAFFAGASESTLDKQGRVLIPQNLKEHANLDRDVYINGAGARIEIWDAEAWAVYTDDMTSDMDDLAEEMEKLGISF
ncbi:division/cell wall cluster transcriptional repressor MraZ [Fusibacter paucivorans]|uniref:Transcriptional regulator MraZ n=1 Tax=Fusibacter paucivorans TaxID=76009 RepID=A0ABS5PR40_9FIRM|nr:division/cell wall cluster transcriptional repressor MraZ [Fusibacter paucivorans]MBS7527531.1 division/cell wall cluster transcriptional repressor MraZ [Fusibacter paucivorans]